MAGCTGKTVPSPNRNRDHPTTANFRSDTPQGPTWTPPSASSRPRATRSGTRTWPARPRSSTPTCARHLQLRPARPGPWRHPRAARPGRHRRRRRRVNPERPISRRPSTPAAAAVFSSSALYRHWPFRCCSSPVTCWLACMPWDRSTSNRRRSLPHFVPLSLPVTSGMTPGGQVPVPCHPPSV